MPKVAIFMGSKSDLDKVKPCSQVLEELGIDYFMTITSAHRTPERTATLIKEMEEKGCEVFICAAGMAAHLAGVVASKTLKPVIGIPINASLGGLDALLSTVQMPPGFPVATVAIDKAGAKNAAWLAAQILALKDANLAQRLREAREKFVQEVEEASKEVEVK
ncbi:MAG: 5-(carboxyamino)imidazole ribonucleotide mutase [Desulfonauticus sp.]|jgi:5-(carboxyamino)imidazole ribonucleotide mutase|nr:MAG: N5-carboxyaminoimidazole ribonucleotide mutase [Desulfonauticus sp. 38_4375]MDK2920532.1 5-(carboxyamino)imidazole ribonucleotide mutase [Desulfonauticus sp.]